MNTGQIIKKVLKEHGIKQKWLADKLRISQSRLTMILKRDVRVNELASICRVTNIPIMEMINECNKKDAVIPPRTSASSTMKHD